MKRHLLVAASLVTVGGAALGLGSEAIANAQTTTKATTTTNTSDKDGHHRHMRLETRLNQAVRDGTITKDQKAAFLAELKSLKTERKTDISKSSTATERQAEHMKVRGELQAWASANNFPLAKIAPKLAS